jgi:hypothetical protein
VNRKASGTLSLSARLNLDQTLRVTGRTNDYDIRTRRLKNWTVGTEWNMSFKLQGLRKAGRLSGTVFLDLNRNGRKETGEPPAPGVTLILGDGREVLSSSAGTFELDRVPPGTASLSLLEEDLPEIYALAGTLFKVEVSEFGTSQVEIPVQVSRPSPQEAPATTLK